MDCFDFDCPREYVDLNGEFGETDLNWFSVVHLLHEISPVPLQKKSASVDENPTKKVVPLVQFTKEAVTNNKTKRKTGQPFVQNDQSPSKKKSRITEKTGETQMLILLRKHNEKFAPVTKYEPPRHSVRDVRKWEKISGKGWSVLTQEERISANEEILRMKKK
jgi:hypothetical protein